MSTVTIKSGQALSSIFAPNTAQRLLGIYMPAGWDAANLTFQGSPDGQNFYNMFDRAGNEINISAATGIYISLVIPIVQWDIGSSSLFAPYQQIIIRSGTNALPVNQTADRIISLHTT